MLLCNVVRCLYEPGLAELVQKNYGAGRLSFHSTMAECMQVEVLFIAVGTPALPGGGANLEQVYGVAQEVETN